MAHIFKYKMGSEFGVITLTHKEMFYIQSLTSVKKSKNPVSLIKSILLVILFRKKIIKLIETLKTNYLVGVHWGWYFNNIKSPDWVDFHLAEESTCTFTNDVKRINLNSSKFIPKSISSKPKQEKFWDILCVAKSSKVKKLDEFLLSIRKIYDRGYSYKVLLLIASNLKEPDNLFYNDIFNDYNKLFSPSEKELFTIIKTHPKTGFQGLSYTTLGHFYRQSKVFALFSELEGVAKVIKEAQFSGLPIVLYSKFKGGGQDYVNKNNSITFDSYENAYLSLINAVENYTSFNIDLKSISNELDESININKLKNGIKNIYKDLNLKWETDLINTDFLNRRLPAHFYEPFTIPWAKDEEFRYKSTDILSIKMLKNFIHHVSNYQYYKQN